MADCPDLADRPGRHDRHEAADGAGDPGGPEVPTSPVRALFTSRSCAGAWQVRGEQVAALRANWRAVPRPAEADLAACDLVCVVKRPDLQVVERARALGKAVVFDIVDSWAQPADGLRHAGVAAARALFAPAWRALGADGYIFPTQRMAQDLGDLVRRGVVIHHHHRPGIARNPVRERVATVGYEGADYLGEWRGRLEAACAARGLRFVTNPARYTDLDIVVLARGGEHASFLARSYKSNIKLANAYGSGTPALVHAGELSAQETDCGDVLFFTDAPGSLERQLDRLCASHALRLAIHRRFLAAAVRFRPARIAGAFEAFFLHLLRERADRHADRPAGLRA